MAACVCTCAVLAGCGTGTGVNPGGPAVPAMRSSAPKASLPAVARADAQSLLASFTPPPGATRLAHAPDPVPVEQGTPLPTFSGTYPSLVLLTQWWTYRGTAAQALAWLEAHPPRGTSPGGTVNSTDIAVYASGREYDRPLTAQLGRRSLGVTVQQFGDHTLLRVDAQSAWLPPRPAGAAIPGGVRSLVVVARPGALYESSTTPPTPSAGVDPGGPERSARPKPRPTPKPVTLATVTDRQQLDQVVALIDGLPMPLPGVRITSCPQITGGSLTLEFYGADSRTPVATVIDSGGCGGGVVLSVRGGPQKVGLGGPEDVSGTVLSMLRLTFPPTQTFTQTTNP